MTENTRPWWYRFLPDRGEPKQNGAPIIAETDTLMVVGLIKRGTRLVVVSPDADKRGVRLVSIPHSLLKRYEEVDRADADMQDALRRLDYSYRPRKPKTSVVGEPSEA